MRRAYGCISNNQYICSVSAGRQETFYITYLINNSISDKLMPSPSAILYFHFVVNTSYLLDLVSTIETLMALTLQVFMIRIQEEYMLVYTLKISTIQ